MVPEPPLAPMLLDAAATLVRRRIGLTFTGARASALESGLIRAMQGAGLSDPALYLAQLDREPPLLDALIAEVTVGETYFFRDPGQWEVLRTRVLPRLLARRPEQQPVRIWSAGCATGEEPYTAAILLHQLGALTRAQIRATDLSRKAVATARRARYSRWSLRGVPEQIINAYFRPAGRWFELVPSIRAPVEFGYLNLAEDEYPGPRAMDVILCRNVLIYFAPETVTRVAGRLLDSLSDDGWLLLGPSDPVLTELVPCDVEVTDAGLAYRRHAPAVTVSIRESPPREYPPPESPAPESPPPAQPLTALAAPPVQDADDDPAARIALVRALANRGELAEAGRVCAAALERHRESAELAYLQAVLLGEAGRHAEAAAAARLALYLDRHLIVAHLALAGALARSGNVGGARRATRNAQRLLAAMSPDEIVPASDGEPAARLAAMAETQLALLGKAAS